MHEITKRYPQETYNTGSLPTIELIWISHSGESLVLTLFSYTFRSQVSSPSIATSSANRQLVVLEGKSGPYFSSLDSSIEILKKRAQELIENINESRQKDHALMTNFRDSLKIKVTDSPIHIAKPQWVGVGKVLMLKVKGIGNEPLLSICYVPSMAICI